MDLSMQLYPPANLVHLHALWVGYLSYPPWLLWETKLRQQRRTVAFK